MKDITRQCIRKASSKHLFIRKCAFLYAKLHYSNQTELIQHWRKNSAKQNWTENLIKQT